MRTRWIVTLSGLTALLVAALAVATNIATSRLPDDWDWARNGALMWTVVGVLTSVVVTTTAVGTRLSLPARAAVVTNLAPRNPHFTGRADHLAQLGRAFRARTAVAVLQGLGGSGKTQTVLEYAQRRQERSRSQITMPPGRAGRSDDRQPSLGLPSGMIRNLANTTHPYLTDRYHGHAAAPPFAPKPIRTTTKPSNQRLDR